MEPLAVIPPVVVTVPLPSKALELPAAVPEGEKVPCAPTVVADPMELPADPVDTAPVVVLDPLPV